MIFISVIVYNVMNISEYIRKRTDESVDYIRKQELFEAIRPIVHSTLLHEAESKKGEGKNKIKIDDLVDKLMKNKTFKKKAMQYLTDEDAFNGWSDNLDGKTYTPLDNMSDGAKRRNVTQRLKDKKINYAPISYELWPDMTPDAARSWFSKKVDGKNASFSDEEIAKIYKLLNDRIS